MSGGLRGTALKGGIVRLNLGARVAVLAAANASTTNALRFRFFLQGVSIFNQANGNGHAVCVAVASDTDALQSAETPCARVGTKKHCLPSVGVSGIAFPSSVPNTETAGRSCKKTSRSVKNSRGNWVVLRRGPASEAGWRYFFLILSNRSTGFSRAPQTCQSYFLHFFVRWR